VLLPHDDVGAGFPVVLLHAGVADRGMWSDLLPAIAAAGYRAIAPDLPGFGDAPVAQVQAPWLDVLETLDALGAGRAALVGNSFGAAVALSVALVAPERVAALALVSAPAPGIGPSAELAAAWEAEESALERGDIDAAVAAVVDAWTLRDAPQALRDRLAAMQRRAMEAQLAAGEVAEEADPLEDPSADFGRLTMPALVAVGELDKPDFLHGAETLARRLPSARHVVIAGSGHLAPLEQPEAFHELLHEFLRRSVPGG
jgi:pimeloyl-ACP methyl ester carboxylesterase